MLQTYCDNFPKVVDSFKICILRLSTGRNTMKCSPSNVRFLELLKEETHVTAHLQIVHVQKYGGPLLGVGGRAKRVPG